MNVFMPSIIFLCVFPFLIAFALWQAKWEREKTGETKEQQAERRRSQISDDDDDDDRNYQLEDEMLQYYRNKNFDRQQGRE
jgi:hypothetical protein